MFKTQMNTGATPVLVASQNGHLEVVKLLIKHGADIHKANNNGTTSVLIASPCNKQNTTSITLVAHTGTRIKINSPQSKPNLPGRPPPRPFRSSRSP